MTITNALAEATKMTGVSTETIDNDTRVRWLSELDGQIAVEFFHVESWTPYDATSDGSTELIVPFPYDGCYVDYLAAKIYQQLDEIDRYTNEMAACNDEIDKYRKHITRQHQPVTGDLLRTVGGRGAAAFYRGTAPTLVFRIRMAVDFDSLFVTFKQAEVTKVEKTLPECTVTVHDDEDEEYTLVSVPLTQEETLRFDWRLPVGMQITGMEQDTRWITPIYGLTVGRTYKDEVI